ncbi:S8 family peptidase [Aquimarina longa]|uniref:S8 family peptidase n=1 Tax=Aquimarina longa TaxID=1080221 RepID=UPI000784F868|nr:S8 family serine peptidase [Aquimarina longa]
MKKSILLIIGLCLIGAWGCTMDEGNFIEKETHQNSAKNKKNVPIPEIIKDEIVIQFNHQRIKEIAAIEKKQTDIVKEDLRELYENRYKFTINDVKKCDCDNDDIELWKITALPKFVEIEGDDGLVANINKGEPSGVVEADYNFYFKNKAYSFQGIFSSKLSDKVRLNTSGDFINIAILDTGVDYDFFPDRFLYNSSNTSNCQDEISGWDFVNHDNDPKDDQGHGTVVTKIITNQLDLYNIAYSIMAVKTFDQNGVGSYWSNVCGINYLAKKQDNFIVNTSFGFYGITDQDIFKNIVDSASDRLLLVSSAGNHGVDTDVSGNEHFPSGYDSANILTVGGYIKGDFFASPIYGSPYISGILKADGSNYGNSSVDALASYNEHTINLSYTTKPRDGFNVSVQGTSFAAAEVTARAAQLSRQTSGTPLAIKNRTLSSGYIVRGLDGVINDGKAIVRHMINSGGSGPGPTHYNSTNIPVAF